MDENERERLRAPYTYTTDTGALGGVGCVVLFGGIPTVGVLHEIYTSQDVSVFFGALGLVVAILIALYIYFSTEVTVEIDARGLRLSEQRIVGPYRGPVNTLQYIPFDAVTKARELRAHSPSKNGGWNVRYELQFGKHGQVESGKVPGDPMTGPFRELAQRVEAHLGDRFSLEEDFGPMTASVQRQVAEAQAKAREQQRP